MYVFREVRPGSGVRSFLLPWALGVALPAAQAEDAGIQSRMWSSAAAAAVGMVGPRVGDQGEGGGAEDALRSLNGGEAGEPWHGFPGSLGEGMVVASPPFAWPYAPRCATASPPPLSAYRALHLWVCFLFGGVELVCVLLCVVVFSALGHAAARFVRSVTTSVAALGAAPPTSPALAGSVQRADGLVQDMLGDLANMGASLAAALPVCFRRVFPFVLRCFR